MSEFTNTAEVEVRERRLQAILSYHGNAEDLLNKSNKRELKNKNRIYSQCSSCAFSCSANSIVSVEDSVVIGQSPIGSRRRLVARLGRRQSPGSLRHARHTSPSPHSPAGCPHTPGNPRIAPSGDSA